MINLEKRLACNITAREYHAAKKQYGVNWLVPALFLRNERLYRLSLVDFFENYLFEKNE